MFEPIFEIYPNLETERLLLTEIKDEDAKRYHDIRTNSRVIKFMDRDPDKDVEETLKKLREITKARLENKSVNWGLRQKTTGEMIGDLGIWRLDNKHFRGEIGYSMHPDFYGKGLMTEALNRVLDYAFQDAKFHSLEANTHPDNERSIALLKRVGFKQEAYFTENYYYNGKFGDSRIFSLLERWRTR